MEGREGEKERENPREGQTVTAGGSRTEGSLRSWDCVFTFVKGSAGWCDSMVWRDPVHQQAFCPHPAVLVIALITTMTSVASVSLLSQPGCNCRQGLWGLHGSGIWVKSFLPLLKL